ncbi:MAG: RNA polymerase sporulation sigma factor SigK [Clostridia bacterium]|nr:RNA polymerase sporulation sigma factor SigK [Clostridia bacterium]
MPHVFSSAAFHLVYLLLGIGSTQSFPPPLPSAEERRLFTAMKGGDRGARKRLIEHNLRLVAHVVRKYYTSYQNPDELVSIGSLGLVKAIDTFSPENGARFATYAVKCVQNEILMFFRSQKKLSCEVSINETIDVDRDGNPLTYIDVISSDEDITSELDLRIHAERAYRLIDEVLDERERRIIVMRYGLGKAPPLTQREVADQLRISRSYVSRIEKRALGKLKESFGPFIPSFDDT